MPEGIESTPRTEHEAIVRALRDVVRQENGLKKWAMTVAGTVTVAVILGGAVAWRTQGVIGSRLDRVEIDIAEIRLDVRDIRTKVVGPAQRR